MRPEEKQYLQNQTFNICTYNPRTINDLNSYSLDTMLHEVNNINWDIIGFSETKVKESKIEIHEATGDKLFFSSNETSRSNGVGFLVNKTCLPLLEDYQPISDILALLTLKGKFSRLVFIQCYFPTSSHPYEEILELYDNVQSIINDIPKRDHLFIMGDFNCKLGQLHNTFPSAVGKHTLSTANSRGELLAQFCVKNNLLVTNTMFQKKKLFTWTSPDGKTRNQIDFILSRKLSVRLNVVASSALNTPDISDHRMIRTKIRLSFSWPQRKRCIPKHDIEQLKQPEVAARFQLILQNRFTGLESETDSGNIYNTICNGVNDASKETLPRNTENGCRSKLN